MLFRSAVSYDPKHKESLSGALDLPTSIIDSMIEGHMVNLHAIISRLIDKRTYEVTDNMQKNFGLALCMVGELLLCSGRCGFMDARAISVVNQIKDGDNPVYFDLGINSSRTRCCISWWRNSKLLRESFDFVDMANGATGHDCIAYNK